MVLRVSLTAGLSQEGSQETPIASLETALCMDADAIAVSLFLDRAGDIDIYRWLASLVDASYRYDRPVVAEMVAIGRRVWQAPDPQAVTAQIHRVLFEGVK